MPEPKESEAGTKPAVEEYKLFFGNEDFNSRIADCDDLFPVYRNRKGVEDIINNSLTELLKGPSQTEQEQGYYTSLNSGVRVLEVRIEAGTVFADFSRELEEDVAGSCQTLAIRAQINETLLQFGGVDKVVILIEGNPGSVLQP
ncbi:MAG: GerMN domain-containing protein [Acidobacteriota bacterium]